MKKTFVTYQFSGTPDTRYSFKTQAYVCGAKKKSYACTLQVSVYQQPLENRFVTSDGQSTSRYVFLRRTV